MKNASVYFKWIFPSILLFSLKLTQKTKNAISLEQIKLGLKTW